MYFDELTTEVIADGRHLAPELLKLAWKIKGADRLALVTDANRGSTCPTVRTCLARAKEGRQSCAAMMSA